MSYTTTAGIQLKDSDFPLLTETIMTQVGITKNAQTLPFSRLVQLNTALDALQPIPPNATTMWLDNTLLLDSASTPSITYNTINTTSMTLTDPNSIATMSNTNLSIIDQPIYGTRQLNIDAGSLTISDGTSFTTYIDAGSLTLTDTNSGFAPQMLLTSSNTIDINSANGNFSVGDTSNTYNKTNIFINDTHREIDLNAVDLLSNCGGSTYYTLPIQFTYKLSENYNYTLAGSWEMVKARQITLPLELFTLTSGYNTWKVDFAINCRNMTDQTNKEYGMYIEFADVNGSSNVYNGFLFNQTTPFTTHRLGSTYSATSSQSENYIYTDYFDFTGITGSPLEVRLYRFATGNCFCDFDWLITLSKNNIV